MISRSFLAAVCLATSSFAAPPLTTIQDVLFKADGTRFHGTLSISWTSFEAIDRSAIAQQTITVTVVNGNLQVQLVPTTTATPAAFYTVVYNSDGLVQFQETWAVPSSLLPLRIRDVRVSAAGAVGVAPIVDTVQESDVIGLLADLGARPLKGPGCAAGRVAYVNPDRKSTRLNSSHLGISYAVFCLKKKKTYDQYSRTYLAIRSSVDCPVALRCH